MLEKLPDAVGHALRERRAGLDKLTLHQVGLREGLTRIDLCSLAFADHAPIPAQYTADGEGRSPPLQWVGVPAQASSLLLIVEDADAPTPQPLVHAIAVELPPGDGALAEGALASPGHDGEADVKTGRNSYLKASWLPPDPPPGHGAHRYAFQLFALAGDGAFSAKPGREEVIDALRARAVAAGLLIGTYERDNRVRADGPATQSAGAPLAGA